MAEAGPGKIRLFNDFFGAEEPDALTAASHSLGQFRACGEGFADNDAGITILESDGLSGVAQIESANTDQDSTGLCTAKMFDVATMAPIVVEARIRFGNLDTKEFFLGLADVNENDVALETDIIGASAGTTIAYTASDVCGFFLDAELTEDEMWHGPYVGGTSTGPTLSTSSELGVDAVAGEWDVLRLEVDPNGTVRWWVNGDLKQTKAGAVSTSVDLAVLCFVGTKGSTFELVDVDYLLVTASRNWTV